MTDHFDVNNVTVSAIRGPAEALIGLKDILLAAGGSVHRSSAGLGGTHGAGDNWTVLADLDKGAWCVINLVGGTRQLIIAAYRSLLAQYWSIYISVDGSYTTAGESATQCGTPTHYKTVLGDEDITASPVSTLFYGSAAQVWHAFARSNGSFWFFAWEDGGTRPKTMICVDVLGYAVPGDNDPAVYVATYGSLSYSGVGLFNDPIALMGYVPTPFAGDWVISPAMRMKTNSGEVFPDGANRINPHTSKWDVIPVHYGSAQSANSTMGSFKGRSSLFGMSTRAAATDYFTTFNPAKDMARIYPLVLLDWNGSDLEF